MCVDDAYHVMPRNSALVGCDRLVSEPLVIENEEKLVIRNPKEKEGVQTMKTKLKMISKNGSISEFLEYSTSREDSEEEEEPKKKRLKEVSVSDSNTLPPDYTSPNKETEMNMDSTARCETKPKELKSTCESSIQSKLDSPRTAPTYMLLDYPYRRSLF
ncbi:hypothetical protein Tco_1437619 [Tanacetum coccineum]